MNVELFLDTLPYMAEGMIGVFAVTVLIILCIRALSVWTSNGEE